MKKFLIVLLLVLCVSTAYAKKYKRPFVQLEPRAGILIGEATRFGFGSGVVFNPLKNVGLRTEILELSFGKGGTVFNLNDGASLEALIYIPMKAIQPYAFAGFGLATGGATQFTIQGGMGFDFYLNPNFPLFVEPGIVISSVSAGGQSDTNFFFRLLAGARFGIF